MSDAVVADKNVNAEREFRVNFGNDRVVDATVMWIVKLCVAGYLLTWGMQGLAQLLGSKPLQTIADFFWDGGLLNAKALHGEPWRLITSMFLHGGLIHLGLNMLGLEYFHRTIKTQFPRWFWLLIFGFGGWFAGLAMLWWDPASKCVGASGGIMAMWGAAMAAFIRYRRVPEHEQPWDNPESLWSLQKGLLFQIVIEFMIPNVGHAAHLGGFIAGFAMGTIFPLCQQPAVLASRKGICKIAGFYQKSAHDREYFKTVEVAINDKFDSACDFLLVEYDWVDWRNRRKVRYEVLAGVLPATMPATRVEVASPTLLNGKPPTDFEDTLTEQLEKFNAVALHLLERCEANMFTEDDPAKPVLVTCDICSPAVIALVSGVLKTKGFNSRIVSAAIGSGGRSRDCLEITRMAPPPVTPSKAS